MQINYFPNHRKRRLMLLQEIRVFIFGLLGKRTRRLYILRHMAKTNSMYSKRSPVEQVQLFVRRLLYEPARMQLTDSYLSMWGKEFAVPFTWMTVEERAFIIKLYLNRTKLFKTVKETEGPQPSCLLTDFIYDGQIWDIEWRRELLRDYIFDTIAASKAGWEQWAVQSLFLTVMQRLLLNPSGEEKIDPFILDAHHVLQCNGSLIKLVTKK